MTAEIEQRRAWAYARVSHCQAPPPRYGTPEWHALPEGSVERWAAVVVAAEAWALDGDYLLDHLAAEIDAERAAFKRAEDADYIARRDAHRGAWDGQRGRFCPDPRIGDEIEQEWRAWVGEGA